MSVFPISDLKFEISKSETVSQTPGGGEGIRTPDPRVANAVLCQLSYTPDNQFEISNLRFEISEVGCGGGI
jgi:hypothetical protein